MYIHYLNNVHTLPEAGVLCITCSWCIMRYLKLEYYALPEAAVYTLPEAGV